jgi:hypothetical protein
MAEENPPVRQALRRHAEELDITPGAVASNVLSSWVHSVVTEAGLRTVEREANEQ